MTFTKLLSEIAATTVTNSIVNFKKGASPYGAAIAALILNVDERTSILPVGALILKTELTHDSEMVRIIVHFDDDDGTKVRVSKTLASVGINKEWEISFQLEKSEQSE